jgi:hypothetical protein
MGFHYFGIVLVLITLSISLFTSNILASPWSGFSESIFDQTIKPLPLKEELCKEIDGDWKPCKIKPGSPSTCINPALDRCSTPLDPICLTKKYPLPEFCKSMDNPNCSTFNFVIIPCLPEHDNCWEKIKEIRPSPPCNPKPLLDPTCNTLLPENLKPTHCRSKLTPPVTDPLCASSLSLALDCPPSAEIDPICIVGYCPTPPLSDPICWVGLDITSDCPTPPATNLSCIGLDITPNCPPSSGIFPTLTSNDPIFQSESTSSESLGGDDQSLADSQSESTSSESLGGDDQSLADSQSESTSSESLGGDDQSLADSQSESTSSESLGGDDLFLDNTN